MRTALLLTTLFTITFCNAQIVNIPDANFKAALVLDTLINTNGDTEIQVSEATAFAGTISVSSKNITDLTGIEAFVNITVLRCYDNPLTALDVSNNLALTELYCYKNLLTTLDVTNNTALTSLWCFNNQLTALDVTNNTALTKLECDRNQLTALNVTNNTVLANLWCRNNQLTTLDVTNNTALETLLCGDNPLTTLDVTNNTALKTLHCYNNQLTSLDVTNNTALTILRCYSNQLTSLNIANGNNVSITFFTAVNNPNLTCIQTDASIVGTNPTEWNKDATAIYSEDCAALGIEDEFLAKAIAIYPNPTQSVINLTYSDASVNLQSIQVFNLLGKQMADIAPVSKTIDLANYTSGIYFVKLTADKGGTFTKKIVKL